MHLSLDFVLDGARLFVFRPFFFFAILAEIQRNHQWYFWKATKTFSLVLPLILHSTPSLSKIVIHFEKSILQLEALLISSSIYLHLVWDWQRNPCNLSHTLVHDLTSRTVVFVSNQVKRSEIGIMAKLLELFFLRGTSRTKFVWSTRLRK